MKIILVVILFLLSSCQTVKYKEYSKSGKIVKEYERIGALNWSDNKDLSIRLSGAGL
jgi:hypothetical protein